MIKLEVLKEVGVNKEDIFVYNFVNSNGTSKFLKFQKETHEAIKNYYTPIIIKDEKSIPEFDELWKLHPKGNKKTAKDRFIKVIKKVPFSDLKEKLLPYIKSNDFCYLKGLDVWLNPDKEYWDDVIIWKDGKEPENKVIPKNMEGMSF